MSWPAAHRKGLVAANYALAEFGVDKSRRVDIYGVLARLGIVVVFRRLPRLAGAYVIDPSGALGILINANHPSTKQRYSAAHELGHHYLGHGTCVDTDIGASTPWGRSGLSQQEKEAEAFASWFLMPQPLVRGLLAQADQPPRTSDDVYELSLRLGTSHEATSWHLANMKVVDRQTAQGWAKTPPREIKRRVAGTWAPDDIRNDVWVLGLPDDRSEVVVRPGDRLLFRLDETPSTGYGWLVASELAPWITVLGESYEELHVPGGNGQTALDVAAGSARKTLALAISPDAGRASANLQLSYELPWEADSARDHLSLDLRVEPSVTGVDAVHYTAAAA